MCRDDDVAVPPYLLGKTQPLNEGKLTTLTHV